MNDVMSIAGRGEGSDLLLRVPEPPKHLNDSAREGYVMMGNHLATAKRLKNIYLPTLEIFADAYAQWQYALTKIRLKNAEDPGTGYIQVFKNGTSNISPEMTLKKMASDKMLECCKLFGLDPKSDKDLKSTGDPGQTSLLDQFREALNG